MTEQDDLVEQRFHQPAASGHRLDVSEKGVTLAGWPIEGRVEIVGDGRPGFASAGKQATITGGTMGQRAEYPGMVWVRIDGLPTLFPQGFAPEHLRLL